MIEDEMRGDEMRWKAPSREREGAFHVKKEAMKREIRIEL